MLVCTESVENVVYQRRLYRDGHFKPSLTADFVIGASVNALTFDQKLQRDFISRQSPWLAVKAHYSGDFPNDTVGLHNSSRGYFGVSKVENDKLTCYLADYKTFKNYKNIEDYQRAVVSKIQTCDPS
jgi:hypothetical protein